MPLFAFALPRKRAGLFCQVLALNTQFRLPSQKSRVAQLYTTVPQISAGKSSPSHEDLVHSWQAGPYTQVDRRTADRFFSTGQAKFAFSASNVRQLLPEKGPEFAFLGRSNVGKSSLLNKLMGTKLVKTSSQAGQTQQLNAFYVGKSPGRLTLIDTPGYGYKSHGSQGDFVLDYLKKRKTLVRSYLLVEASHGLKSSDMDLIDGLIRHGVSCQIILTKVDKLRDQAAFTNLAKWIEGKIHDEPAVYGEVIGVSHLGQSQSVSSLRCSILSACNKLGANSHSQRSGRPGPLSNDAYI
jgi:GTP-binding protein